MAEVQHILLAEDNANDVELTLAALQQDGLARRVFAVHDGEEALDYLLRRGAFADRPDDLPRAILLDIKMPKLDGLEVLRMIRGDERLKWIPVVMLTSSREEGDVRRSYELGANAYVVKPVDFSQLSQALRCLGYFWGIANEPPPAPPPGEGR
ncbi:MAG TPA: response regulator [Verrucomicrobiae bacterium]|nr:response regulator [Verrucomicrobiae bacterium]